MYFEIEWVWYLHMNLVHLTLLCYHHTRVVSKE